MEGSEEHFDENVAEEEDSTDSEDGSDEEVREHAGVSAREKRLWDGMEREGRPGTLGEGAVGVGGWACLCWSVAGLRCVSSARLRCARSLWAVAGRPPGSDLFPSGMGGRGRAVAGAGGARVRGAAVGTT